jgi:tetratricopeptide (TPR) repeat protein
VDALGSLVDRSLVAMDPAPLPRYRLLESPRAHALELLSLAGEVRHWRHRHALELQRRYEPATADRLHLPDADWHAKYPSEPDNLRAAIDWALGPDGDVALGLALTTSSAMVWLHLSVYAEALARITRAVACVDAQTPLVHQARLWQWFGAIHLNREPGKALPAFKQAADAYHELGDSSGEAWALAHFGDSLARTGSPDEAALALNQAQGLLEGSPGRVRARHHEAMAFLRKISGDLAQARMHYELAIQINHLCGSDDTSIHILPSLADVRWAQSDLDAALASFRDALAALREMRGVRRSMLGVCLTNLAGVHVERGELDEALAAAREGLPLRLQAGWSWGALDHLALRAALTGRLADAAAIAGHTDAAYQARRLPREPNEARARAHLQVLLSTGLSAEELDRLIEAGARLSEEEACRLALLA